jgi:hypothetical protein
MTDPRNQDALKQAAAQLESIVELFNASQEARHNGTASIDGYADDLTEDDIREHAQDNALSTEVRCSEWHVPGDEDGTPYNEFRIVVCTGGPHVEIRGSLNKWGEPENAEVYANDWFTTLESLDSYTDEAAEALDWFCSLFYFGE